MEITIRHAEPEDYEAIHRIMSSPKVAMGTLQLPLQSAEAWRRRLADPPEGLFLLVACADGGVVGNLGLETFPNRPRVRHAGAIGMAVRDDWQGKGIGTSLMGAALDLADNWLNLTRVELTVYVDNAAGTAIRAPALRPFPECSATARILILPGILQFGGRATPSGDRPPGREGASSRDGLAAPIFGEGWGSCPPPAPVGR